jgi:hypothetical protein
VKRLAQCLAWCALSLVSAAHAAVQVVNTSAYQLSYDDTVLTYLGNGELSFNAFAGVDTTSFLNDGGGATPFLTLTASANHLITGVSQSVMGSLSGSNVSGVLMAYTSWAEPAAGYANAIESADFALSNGSFSLNQALDLTGSSGKSLTLMGFRLAAGVMATDPDGLGTGTLAVQSFKLSVASQVSSVPEPQMLALMLAGFGVVMLRRRDQRR